MSLRRRPRGAAAALLVPAALIFALVAPTGATGEPADRLPAAVTAPMPDYPTWQDVQNAKRNQAATQAEIDGIEGILVALENEAAELGKVAQIKAEAVRDGARRARRRDAEGRPAVRPRRRGAGAGRRVRRSARPS